MTQNEPRPIGELLSELLPKYLASQPTPILNVAEEKRPRQIASNERFEVAATQNT